jgi:hypothetical protein
MTELELVRHAAEAAREWRERKMKELFDAGCNDLSFRPSFGMSSFGWLLAHQAAIYDFSINVLVRRKGIKNTKMFEAYKPGTSGDWDGTPIEEIQEYYDSMERSVFGWVESADLVDLDRVIKEGEAPPFFVGMSVRRVLATMFTHINAHSGHYDALRHAWVTK